MRPFSEHDDGANDADWQQVLEVLPPLALPGNDTRIVVLAAHPDDETLGAGGLIAAAGSAGHRVDIVIASRGEASHPRSTTHTPAQLAALRHEEAIAATHELSERADVTVLDLPDGQLDEHEYDLIGAMRSVLRLDVGHEPIWLLTPWSGDRHPDHEACARVGAHLSQLSDRIRLLQYPIWLWHWGDPQGEDLPVARATRIRLADSALDAKRTALSRYRSQVDALSGEPGDEPVLPGHVLTHFLRPVEVLISEPPRSAATPGYFDELYATAADPWDLQTRWYERRKRAVLTACLSRPRFRRGFEPGCATGLLTEHLAERCDELIAADVADAAVTSTSRHLLSSQAGDTVQLMRLHIPDEWPDGQFDLIVLSEVGYYCTDLAHLASRVLDSLAPDGVLVLCHWRHAAAAHPHSGDTVHETLGRLTGLHRLVRHIEEDFLLDVLTCRPESVAVLDGVLP